MKRFILILSALAALTASSLFILGATYTQDITIPPEYAGRHISVEGIPIRDSQQGAGPDVLLIHGSMGSIEDWETLMPELAQAFRVTAFDRLGHGYSAMPATDFTLQDNARLALGAIRKPVVILQGDRDAYRPIKEDSARLAERIPDARLIHLQDTGHYIQYAAPGAVVEALQGLGGTAPRDREHLADRPEHVHHEPGPSP